MRYLGIEDPYRLYHGPDAEPPKSWTRVKTWIYGCALYAEEQEIVKLKAQVLGGERKTMSKLKGLFGR